MQTELTNDMVIRKQNDMKKYRTLRRILIYIIVWVWVRWIHQMHMRYDLEMNRQTENNKNVVDVPFELLFVKNPTTSSSTNPTPPTFFSSKVSGLVMY